MKKAELIIGAGQVGRGLHEALDGRCDIRDVESAPGLQKRYRVLHICFPYDGAAMNGGSQFDRAVRGYVAQYKPRVVIIHSSVRPGYTASVRDIARVVAYSPVRGRHPNLAEHIRQFTKWVAAHDCEQCDEAEDILEPLNTQGIHGDDATTALELCKLLSNIRYGVEIGFMHEVERIGDAMRLPDIVDLFNSWERSYNQGYELVGEHEKRRPILYSGVIGGHCVMQNIDVIEAVYQSDLFAWLKDSNQRKQRSDEMREQETKGTNA